MYLRSAEARKSRSKSTAPRFRFAHLIEILKQTNPKLDYNIHAVVHRFAPPCIGREQKSFFQIGINSELLSTV